MQGRFRTNGIKRAWNCFGWRQQYLYEAFQDCAANSALAELSGGLLCPFLGGTVMPDRQDGAARPINWSGMDLAELMLRRKRVAGD
jgi:hypothetical protein